MKVEGSNSSSTSSRWCPRKEQVMILEELYRGGMRNPSASQIQQITARLSCYGIIQGKNVFYWFQNHKARHRQKLRRSFSLHLLNHHQPLFLSHSYYHHLTNAVASSYQLFPSNLHMHDDQYVCKMKNNADLGVVQLDHSPAASSIWSTTPPLHTLQLFPLKSEGLKDHKHHKHN